MNLKDFAYLAEVLRRRSGLLLTEKKSHLVQSRLAPVMRRFGFKDVGALLQELRHGHEALVSAVIEAMTINDSAFFRDRKTFEEFRDIVLPGLLIARSRSRRLRIWCTACAAGQEPYSIAMILNDAGLAAQGWTIDIIATDLSSEIIARAEDGLYSQCEVQRGLPIRGLLGNFTQEGDNWRISQNLRRMVTFRTFNLLDSFGWLGEMDVVFCRNVLMYFDQKTRTSVLKRIAEVLVPDGALLVGPAESVPSNIAAFAPAEQAPGLYYRSRPAAPLLLRRAVG
ncbi:MAG: protein-glutamate O-methyltransferase CheR [Alphaproteobacteria bacterium]|nr:protein-glutamate O-methyltransferase CheR [Alphaproteobacteria bacterium]MDE2264642.1 protein-glutamate O-methyltransferase CheR [Alphaproteobacteria bacterium]